MQRFLAEDASEQSALFRRADTGELSTSKGCTCALLLERSIQDKQGGSGN